MFALKQERDLILDMLASGKISSDEARRLFDAVERCALLNEEEKFFAPFNEQFEVIRDEIEDKLEEFETSLRAGFVLDY